MMYKTFGDPKDSLLKELAEMAVKKAVTTFVGESVKAVVDIWKTRHLKEMDVEFKERAKARKSEAGDSDENSDKSDEAEETPREQRRAGPPDEQIFNY